MTLKRYIPGAVLLMLAWTINIVAQGGTIGVEEPNLIQQENELPGDYDWQIPPGSEAYNREIEGYASAASVNVGESITFFVNLADGGPRYNLDIYRMGYYGGAGARNVHNRVGISGSEWEWYRGKSLYAGKPGSLLSWGPPVPAGGVPGAQVQARKVSFNRPYFSDNGIYGTAGQFFFRGEYNMLRWMEQNSYDVSYTTDVDIDAATDMINGPLSPGRHKVFLSVGHDEYWSRQMRDNIENARNRDAEDQPLNVGWFGANSVYWQIRFENSSPGSSPGNEQRRTIVAYKHLATNDSSLLRDPLFVPLAQGGSPTNYLTTTLWRENDVAHLGNQCPGNPTVPDCYKKPEDELLGVMTNRDNTSGRGNFEFDLVHCPTWVYSDVNPAAPFTGLVGYEADAFFNYYPGSRDIEAIVAASQFVGPFITTTANAFYYTRDTDGIDNGDDGGARVFAAGTIEWGLGLNNFGADTSIGPLLHPPYYDPRVEDITRNILACLRDGGAACE